MLLGNYSSNENTDEINQYTADWNDPPNNIYLHNNTNSLIEYSSTIIPNHSTNFVYPNNNCSTERSNLSTRANTSINHDNIHFQNIQNSSFSNISVANQVDENSKNNSLPQIPFQQSYNFNSSSFIFSTEMNNNQGFSFQKSVTSTTTHISGMPNSQFCEKTYPNYVFPLYANNNSNNVVRIPQNQFQCANSLQFNRSSSHIGLVQNSPYPYNSNLIPEKPFVDQLSHSFSNFSINHSVPNTHWNSNSFGKTNENCPLENKNPNSNFLELPQKTENMSNSYNNAFNHIPNFNSSSQSLPPQSCLTPNMYQNKDLKSLPTSMSISTPAVAPDNHRTNPTDMSLVPAKMTSYNDNQQKNSNFDSNVNNMTPSRRMINVIEERLLIPPTGIMNPVPNLLNITKKPNCDPSIMRCTLNSVPNNEDLLNKTRLPFVIHIHAFKDLANLQVIRSEKIVRCRTLSCRAYLNPFVSLFDHRRWKCNICQRINELTNDFLYDESREMYIETQKRPEVRLATVEYIAPKEYSMKNIQVPVYVFMIDISTNAICTLYSNVLNRILNAIDELLDRLPGYQHAKFTVIGYDHNIHLFPITEKRCHEIVLSDISMPIEIPNSAEIFADIHKHKDQIQELLASLLDNLDSDSPSQVTPASNCLGSAILVAKQLINNLGGRITIFNASCPSLGEGILFPRDTKKSNNVFPLAPEKDFYKTLSLECAQAQIGVDLFQLGQAPCDLATLSVITRYCGGSLFYFPDLTITPLIQNKENAKEDDKCILELQRLLYDLNRYLTRKIGFDAVLRVRYSHGLNIQSSHGNFFARASDLYSMANINPDSGVALKIGISDSFIDNNVIFFQAALLYTSSLGERRIRVHTLCLPVTSQIDDVFRMADHQAIAGFLTKSVSDRLQTTGKIIEAREALINAVVDPSSAFGEFCLTSSQILTSLPFPYHLRLLPLYVWGILQSRCLQLTNNDPDCSVAILDTWRNMPLSYLLTNIYPCLFNLTSVAYLSYKQKEKLNSLLDSNDKSSSGSPEEDVVSNIDNTIEPVYSSDSDASPVDSDACSSISCYNSRPSHQHGDRETRKPNDADIESDDEEFWFPEHLHLTMQSLSRCGVYLLETSRGLLMLMRTDTPRVFYHQIFGVDSFSELPTNGNIQLPELNNAASLQLRLFIKDLQIDRPIGSHLFVINNFHSSLNAIFQSNLLEDDRLDSSYHRFLKQIQRKVNR